MPTYYVLTSILLAFLACHCAEGVFVVQNNGDASNTSSEASEGIRDIISWKNDAAGPGKDWAIDMPKKLDQRRDQNKIVDFPPIIDAKQNRDVQKNIDFLINKDRPILADTSLVNIALNKAITVSSVETNYLVGANAVDGLMNTRWSSGYTDNEWIIVDLGQSYNISRLKLFWEAAFGRAYTIQISENGTSWTEAYSTMASDGGLDEITFVATTSAARYVKMQGITRGTGFGYSLWEIEIYQ